MKITKAQIVGIVFSIIAVAVALLPITRDSLKWRLVSSHDRAQDYAEYLASLPSGSHASEAKTRYDERSWAEAQSMRTLEAYRQYEQAHPTGSHLTEARDFIEQCVWQQSTNANTIKAFAAYAEAYPKGRFASEAQSKQVTLRTDDTPYSAALKNGTEKAMRDFLSEFPGHAKEPDAKKVIKDITEGQDIVDLLAEKKVEIDTQGSGIESVSVRVRKLVSYPLTLRIPVGTFFVSANQSSQNMVTTAESKVRLTGDGWQHVSTSTACANRPRDIPSGSDKFSVQRSPNQDELTKLMPILDRAHVDYATRQAAVWIVTDNANYSDLGILVASSNGFDGSRVINEPETGHAMKICDEAGIDITRKAIWRDRQYILRGLRDAAVKKWMEEKK